ncbi:MAG: TnsA endonuclease N-terminal domain-containing protein [Nitrospiraceae bacterium]|nr:TnsA endonuclease N-terminal domain-containing protein [Nitrospiraceae bacterium]
MVHCESPKERDYCIFLEFDSRVRRYQEQPLAIPYVLNGEDHEYFVDFMVELIGGRKQLIEVKSASEVDFEENLCKFAAARAYAEDNDMEFSVVTEKDLHKGFALENMHHIYRHGAIRLDTEMILSIMETISPFDQTMVETIITALAPISKCHDPRSILLWLIWKGKIAVDVTQKIESTTAVKVRRL